MHNRSERFTCNFDFVENKFRLIKPRNKIMWSRDSIPKPWSVSHSRNWRKKDHHTFCCFHSTVYTFSQFQWRQIWMLFVDEARIKKKQQTVVCLFLMFQHLKQLSIALLFALNFMHSFFSRLQFCWQIFPEWIPLRSRQPIIEWLLAAISSDCHLLTMLPISEISFHSAHIKRELVKWIYAHFEWNQWTHCWLTTITRCWWGRRRWRKERISEWGNRIMLISGSARICWRCCNRLHL